MPREMFIYKINETLARYAHDVERVDLCSGMDLTSSDGYRELLELVVIIISISIIRITSVISIIVY